jgi:hypothetical protein
VNLTKARNATTCDVARRSIVETDAVMADVFVRRLVFLVYLYPLFWVTGLGATFFLVAAAVSLPYLASVRLCVESWIAIGIATCIVFSIPVGLLTFGFQPWRALSALGNIAVWISLAAGISAGQLTHVRPRLSAALITVAGIQGAATLVAVTVYPRQLPLPLPLLKNYAGPLPTGFRQFSEQRLAYSGWLEGFSIRSSGLMANPTWAAAFAALAALLALAELSRRKHQLLVACAVLLCGVSIYYSLSRSIYIIVVLAVAGSGIFVLQRRNRRELAVVVAISMPVLATLILSNWAYISDSIVRINAARAGSLVERIAIYNRTWQYWWQELKVPLIGFGIKPQESDLWASVASHSTYPGLLFRGGVIALLLLMALLVRIIRRAANDQNALGASIIVVITLWMTIGDIDVGHLSPLFLIFCVADPRRQAAESRQCREINRTGIPSTPIGARAKAALPEMECR